MAKGFPYFKFIATEWLTGDICYEELDVQGLFINVCALYWQRDGKVSLEDIKKRYKQPTALKSLTDRFILVKQDFISIKFLDEQLIEAGHISKVNSENGKKGGRRKATEIKPTANRPLIETKQTPNKEELEEEIELNKRKAEIEQYSRPRDFLKSCNEIELNEIEMKSQMADFEDCLEQWSLKVESSDFKYSNNKGEDYRKLKAGFQKWLNTWKSKEKISAKKESHVNKTQQLLTKHAETQDWIDKTFE